MAKAALHPGVVGWVVPPSPGPHGSVTVRWRRGEDLALVLAGRWVGDLGRNEVLATVAVQQAGWVDLEDLRLLGQRWLRGAR